LSKAYDHDGAVDGESPREETASAAGQAGAERAADSKAKTERESLKFQGSSIDSLLNTPSWNRDDNIVWSHMGQRLGMDPDIVPRPATRVVGIRNLVYRDPPPPGAERKKRPVARITPGMAWETCAADGRRGGVRMYLGELGEDPDGKARRQEIDCFADGVRPTGCAVPWGNPDTATTAYVCVGVENGAAIAYAIKAEIDSGEAIVCACTTNSNMEAFKPWPATTTLVLCPDRDEAAKGVGGLPTLAGEKSAHLLGALLRSDSPTFEIEIAKPGDPDTNTTFRDLLVRCGADAVLTTLSAAQEFEPDPAAVEKAAQHAAEAAMVAQATREYPLPSTVDGRWFKYHVVKGEVWAIIGGDRHPTRVERRFP
jgi:hypothetical protein